MALTLRSPTLKLNMDIFSNRINIPSRTSLEAVPKRKPLMETVQVYKVRIYQIHILSFTCSNTLLGPGHTLSSKHQSTTNSPVQPPDLSVLSTPTTIYGSRAFLNRWSVVSLRPLHRTTPSRALSLVGRGGSHPVLPERRTSAMAVNGTRISFIDIN